MIKLIAGQMWASNNSQDEFTLNIGANGLIHGKSKLGGIYNWNKTDFHRCFKFIPQNDLEWLAVNEDEWCETIRFNVPGDGCCSRKQWQNMRYHLGLDKKPHYRLTGGDWVKV